MYPVGGTHKDVSSILGVTGTSQSVDVGIGVARFEQIRRESFEILRRQLAEW